MVKESFNMSFIIDILPKLIKVVPVTLMIAVASIIIGFMVGLILAIIKLSRFRVLRKITDYYTVLVRAIPDVVLIYIVYFGVPMLIESISGVDIGGWKKQAFVIAALATALSATSSELFRSAYNAIDRGQLEAAHAIGMTRTQRFFRVIFPQGLFVILPNLSGLSLGIIQATSLSFVLGIMDVMGKAKLLDTNSFGMNTFEAYVTVALIYWIISLLEGLIFKLLEKKTGRGMKTVATAS